MALLIFSRGYESEIAPEYSDRFTCEEAKLIVGDGFLVYPLINGKLMLAQKATAAPTARVNVKATNMARGAGAISRIESIVGAALVLASDDIRN